MTANASAISTSGHHPGNTDVPNVGDKANDVIGRDENNRLDRDKLYAPFQEHLLESIIHHKIAYVNIFVALIKPIYSRVNM